MYAGNFFNWFVLMTPSKLKPSQLVDDSKSPFCETERMIIATHCDVNTAPLPRVTRTYWPVGASVLNRSKYSKFSTMKKFSTIIPMSHVTLRSSIGSMATKK